MRAGLLLLGLGFLPAPHADGPTKLRESTRIGKVVELTAALKALGVPADPEPIAKQVVLKEGDGAITPILSDEASRALFLDARLRDRKVRLKTRMHDGLPYLQIVTIEVEEKGVFRTPEYFCDVCTISVRYPQTCPCCQAPMVFRMKPDTP